MSSYTKNRILQNIFYIISVIFSCYWFFIACNSLLGGVIILIFAFVIASAVLDEKYDSRSMSFLIANIVYVIILSIFIMSHQDWNHKIVKEDYHAVIEYNKASYSYISRVGPDIKEIKLGTSRFYEFMYNNCSDVKVSVYSISPAPLLDVFQLDQVSVKRTKYECMEHNKFEEFRGYKYE